MKDVLKRYFPVILKPIILTLLFFVAIVWIYLTLSAVSPNWFTQRGWSPEMQEIETARASNLGSFLMNLFRGNFGISFITLQPVWNELAWRFPNTLLLIGLSIVFSLVIGIGLSMLFKPGKRRPSTLAHSLRGFFFGLVPVIAIPLTLFFSYYSYVWFGYPIFPTSGLHSVPPPTNPLAYLSDVLWHLFLPVATLTLIGVFRIFLVIWNSGSTFTERTILKKTLLPCTTIDFTVMILAVIPVEFVFSWPGIGRWYIESLFAGDLNVLVGSFVMFLALAVGLGYVSVLLDFIQRLAGLREDLERKVTADPKINPTQTKGGIMKYIRLFLRRKALVIGSAIVIVFLVLAVFAPFITPHDPIMDTAVAESFAQPEWATIFPQNQNLPRTMELTSNWNVEEKSASINVTQSGEDLVVQYGGGGTGTQSINSTTSFMYPYSAPKRFIVKFTWWTGNIENAEYSLDLFVVNPNREKFVFWTSYLYPMFEFSSQNKSMTSVTSYSTNLPPHIIDRLKIDWGTNVAHLIFAEPGEYKLQLQMRFRPMSPNGTAEIYFADTELKIPGLIHGILGCDSFGGDIFAQLVYGASTAVILAFPTAFLAVILGFQFGFLAGYFQSWADNVITPIVDSLLCLPILPILLVNIVLLGASPVVFLPASLLFLAAIAIMAFRNKFLVRSSNQKFRGNTPAKKVLNVLKDLVANFCLTVISLTLLLSTIEFFGLGDPAVMTWGRMINLAFSMGAFSRLAWWWILPPIACIALFALGLFLVGVGLEDIS